MGRVAEFIRHAFAVDKGGDLNNEEKELLTKISAEIVKRRLSPPAIIFLETMSPLNFIGSQASYFFQPILGIVTDAINLEKLGTILEKRNAIPFLIGQIESGEKEWQKN